MQKSNAYYKLRKSFLTAVCLVTLVTTANAQANDQTASLTIISGNISSPGEPADFNFNRTFVPSTGTNLSYRVLDPSDPSQTFQVNDSDTTRGFLVTISMSELHGTNEPRNRELYSRISTVTLSQSSTEEVDGLPTNNPSGGGSTIAPMYCGWSGASPFETTCSGLMTVFEGTTSATTQLSNPVATTDTTISLVNSAGMRADGIIKINDDIIYYAGIAGNTLTGTYGIDTTHNNGDTVEQYSLDSQQYTVMENATDADFGIYSIGFGFELNVDNQVKPDDYQGTLTFSLIPS